MSKTHIVCETIDAIAAHRGLVSGISRRLAVLAGAMDCLGMREPADELWQFSDDLVASAKTLNDAFSADQTRELRRHEEAIAGNIIAILERAAPKAEPTP